MNEKVKDAIAGMCGGLMMVVFTHPLDTVKIRLQISKNIYTSSLDCLVKTLRREGAHGLYRGISAALVGVPPIYGVVFTFNGLMRAFLDGHVPSHFLYPLAGLCSACVSVPVVVPIGLITTRLQSQSRSLGVVQI